VAVLLDRKSWRGTVIYIENLGKATGFYIEYVVLQMTLVSEQFYELLTCYPHLHCFSIEIPCLLIIVLKRIRCLLSCIFSLDKNLFSPFITTVSLMGTKYLVTSKCALLRSIYCMVSVSSYDSGIVQKCISFFFSLFFTLLFFHGFLFSSSRLAEWFNVLKIVCIGAHFSRARIAVPQLIIHGIFMVGNLSLAKIL